MSREHTKQTVISLIGEKAPWVSRSLCFLAHHGSMAYGTHVEGSDTDIKGIMIQTLKALSDPFDSHEQVGSHDQDYDILVYDSRKFLKLTSAGNPGVAELLWLDESDWIYTTPAWDLLYKNRDRFLTQEMCNRFMAYAIGQLHDLKRALTKGIPETSSRYPLYLKYGFDTKAASHAVRVSRMCREVATDGTVRVRRPDAEELLRIRNGRCKLDDLMDEIEDNVFFSAENIKGSPLPEKMDPQFVRELSWNMTQTHLFGDLNTGW